jgi:hypothetical protein
MRHRVLNWVRMAILGAVVSMTLGSMARAQSWGRYDEDDSYYRHDQAREHGFQNGYRDGFRAGQYDSARGRRFKFKNDDWEDAHGFERWMGNHGHYKQAYREGYEQGYGRGYGYFDGRYRDRDDDRWRYRDWR